jgi:hypothetical protein
MLAKIFGGSLSLILLNKFIIIQNPLFNMGFFDYYQSKTIYPFFILSIAIGTYLILRRKKVQEQTSKLVISAFIYLGLVNYYFFGALVIFYAFEKLNIKEKQEILNILTKALLVCVGIGIYQLLTFKSLGLQVLGEPNISKNILGLSTINVYGHEIIRAYGTMAHPNILAGYIAVLTSFKMLNIVTFSISGVISHINWLKFKLKSLIPLIIVLLVKNPFINQSSYIERVEELQSVSVAKQVHNVYLSIGIEDGMALLVYLIILLNLYKIDKSTAITLALLGMFDHYLISHPQGIMLIPIAFLVASIKKQKMLDDHSKSS